MFAQGFTTKAASGQADSGERGWGLALVRVVCERRGREEGVERPEPGMAREEIERGRDLVVPHGKQRRQQLRESGSLHGGVLPPPSTRSDVSEFLDHGDRGRRRDLPGRDGVEDALAR